MKYIKKKENMLALGLGALVLGPQLLAQTANAEATPSHTSIESFNGQEGHETISRLFNGDLSDWTKVDKLDVINNTASFNGDTYNLRLDPWSGSAAKGPSYATNVYITKNGDSTVHTYVYSTGQGTTSWFKLNDPSPQDYTYTDFYTKRTTDGNTMQAAVAHLPNNVDMINYYNVTTDGLIEHYWTFKNNGNQKYSVPLSVGSCDTDLDGNDHIPIIADGYGGTYIQNSAVTLWSMPISDNVTMWANTFNQHYDTGQKTAGRDRGSTILDAVDTNLSYVFTPKDLEPGQSVSYGFRESLYPAPIDPLHQGEIVVRYEDEKGNEISPRTATFGTIGSDYHLQPKNIDHWVLAATPDKDTIKYDIGTTKATYIYKHKNTDVSIINNVQRDIHYSMPNGGDTSKLPKNFTQTGTAQQKATKDEVTGVVTNGEWVNGKFDAVNVPQIAGYTSNMTTIPASEINKDTPKTQTVDVTYVPNDEHVKVRYVDQDGNDIASPETLTGKMDTSYKTSAKQIDGWKITQVPQNANGTYGVQNSDVVYRYEPDIRNINVHYVDENGNKLAPDRVIQGKYKSAYKTDPVPVHGYHVEKMPSNAQGTYQVTNPDITFVYSRNPEKAMLYYVDQNGSPMAWPETIKGLYGDHYTTKAETFSGYHLTQTPQNASGVLDEHNADIVYRYAPDKTGMNVVHRDRNDQDVSPSSQISGNVNTYYETNKSTPKGYHWSILPWNMNGVFGAKNDDVRYGYDKDVEHIKVRYVDKNGQDLAPSDEVSGEYGTPYSANAKKIWDYHVIKMPENATGNFDTKNDDIVFVYEPDTEHVKVSYFDDWGHKLAEDDDVAGEFGSEYQTKPKNFAQYQLIQASPNANGKFGRHNADVHYVYTKIEQPQSSAVSSSASSAVSSNASSAESSAASSASSAESSAASSASSTESSAASSASSTESSAASSASSTQSSAASSVSSAESKTSSAASSASSTQSSAASSASSTESKTSSAVSSASSMQSSAASSVSSAESKTSSAASSASSMQSSAASSASSTESKTSSAASSASSTQSSVTSSVSSTQSSAVASSAASSAGLSSVVTHWFDENGKELKPQENGAHPDNDNISDINGYKLASTEVDAKGNVINRYVKDDSIKPATTNLPIKQDDAKQTETNANNAQNNDNAQTNADVKPAGAKTSDQPEKQDAISTDNAQAGTNTPNNADQQTSTGKTDVVPASASANRLPQTGDETIKLSAAGLSLLASLGLTAIGIKKRKED